MDEAQRRDEMPDALDRGLAACREQRWEAAFEHLTVADARERLSTEGLEWLARAAYLSGRPDDYLATLERLHHRHLEGQDAPAAARWAFWSGLELAFRGEMGHATGWFQRAQRLIEGVDCVEHGYLLLAEIEKRLATGDHEGADRAGAEAASLGERFGDPDLVACARNLQGKARLQAGRIAEGLPLLDEAMVAVTAGELSPIVMGLIYCNVIDVCQKAYVLGRAREWTSALAEWCERQPQMIAFTTTCLIQRAEVLRIHGAWSEALAEARRASERFAGDTERDAPAAAFYQQAEVHRLWGDFEAAEAAYRLASQGGMDPQPGLALLRLAQGRHDAAAAAIRRALSGTAPPLSRAGLLSASVEIMLDCGAHNEAEVACRELEDIARAFHSEALGAMAAQARGAIELGAGHAPEALEPLRRAWTLWREVDAPYAAARARLLIGLASRAMGDDEGARLELEASRTVFASLRAAHDLAAVDELTRAPRAGARGLTRRELQVLRLVATGRTNRVIAGELFISERTVERHVSNIFQKLRVSSRSAATAHAYEHGLI